MCGAQQLQCNFELAPQIIGGHQPHQALMNWYQYVTDFIPISHKCVRITHVLKKHIAFMRILHIDKIHPNYFAFFIDSNSSHVKTSSNKLGRK